MNRGISYLKIRILDFERCKLKKIIIPIVMVALLSGMVKADYKLGKKYFLKKDYKKANAEFQMDVEGYRTYWFYPAYMSAVCFFKQKDYSATVEMLRVAEEGAAQSENKAQEMAQIKILETQVLIETKKFSKAVQLAKKYIPQSPADQQAELYYWTGYTYNKLKNYSKAINDLKQSLGLYGNRKSSKIPLANYQLGFAFAQNRSFQAAIKPLEKALARRKRIKPAYYLLTDIYLNVARSQKKDAVKKAKYLKASDWAQKGLNIYRNDKKLMKNLANANLGSKQYDNSISVFENLVKKYPKDKDILFGLGSAYMGKKDFKKALPYLTKVQPQMRKNPLIYTYIASAYLSISKEYKKTKEKQVWVNNALNILAKGIKNCGAKSSLKNKRNEANKMAESLALNSNAEAANIQAMKDNLFKLQDRITLLKQRIRKGEQIKRDTGYPPKSFESDKKELEKTQADVKSVKRELNKLLKEAK